MKRADAQRCAGVPRGVGITGRKMGVMTRHEPSGKAGKEKKRKEKRKKRERTKKTRQDKAGVGAGMVNGREACIKQSSNHERFEPLKGTRLVLTKKNRRRKKKRARLGAASPLPRRRSRSRGSRHRHLHLHRRGSRRCRCSGNGRVGLARLAARPRAGSDT